ncbi:hypothetical protein AOQ84DRAFT_305507 [Glonium stellatum]|uniref:Uncharacterized protein n=1 Tax=Glonium stellatum TaxID=574774 RepID=A0A8E2JMC9_9PEZI|nr:hypothetical protein AOQ84DRAFT_305507 [Glonium stellatum]
MSLVLGIFLGGCVTAIPVVTGIAEGVAHQKKQNEEAANETRMVKFNLDVFCAAESPRRDEVHGCIVVLRNNKVWLAPKDPSSRLPIPSREDLTPPLHAFAGFYIQYPDEDRNPCERGLVSTISDDPPMLNWIYVDKTTLELKYGNRSASIQHIVGEWDWTEDEAGLTLEGWEGFVTVEEEEQDGLRWALYFDRDDDKLGQRKKVQGREVLECSLERRVLSEEQQLKQMEEADKKMQVKSTGGLKTKWGP